MARGTGGWGCSYLLVDLEVCSESRTFSLFFFKTLFHWCGETLLVSPKCRTLAVGSSIFQPLSHVVILKVTLEEKKEALKKQKMRREGPDEEGATVGVSRRAGTGSTGSGSAVTGSLCNQMSTVCVSSFSSGTRRQEEASHRRRRHHPTRPPSGKEKLKKPALSTPPGHPPPPSSPFIKP